MPKRQRNIAIALTCATGLVALSAPLCADVDVIPVAGSEVTSEITGIVEIVNTETRMLTIRTPDGRFQVIHVPAEVQRLDEIKIGNRLTISQTDAVLIDLVKGDEAGAIGVTQETRIDQEATKRPAGTITDTLTLYGRVESIDRDQGTVSIQGAEETIEFDVNDPALLAELEVGDGVVATFIHAVSGQVEFR